MILDDIQDDFRWYTGWYADDFRWLADDFRWYTGWF